MKIAHIINPVKVNIESDLYLAQPVTFQSMLNAKEFARDIIQVDLYTTQYQEDREIIPNGFIVTDDLTRSILDLNDFKIKRKLPLIKDILDKLYDYSDAEFLIYTNVDIGLQPYFYMYVKQLIEFGWDGICINRKTLPEFLEFVSELNVNYLPIIYSIEGKRHPGIDCFVFRRDIYPNFKLGNICIGVDGIGAVLKDNIKKFSNNFMWGKNVNTTFHLGATERSWEKRKKYADYYWHNSDERDAIDASLKIIGRLEKIRKFFRVRSKISKMIK